MIGCEATPIGVILGQPRVTERRNTPAELARWDMMHLSVNDERFARELGVKTAFVDSDPLVAVLVSWIGFGGPLALPLGAPNPPRE